MGVFLALHVFHIAGMTAADVKAFFMTVIVQRPSVSSHVPQAHRRQPRKSRVLLSAFLAYCRVGGGNGTVSSACSGCIRRRVRIVCSFLPYSGGCMRPRRKNIRAHAPPAVSGFFGPAPTASAVCPQAAVYPDGSPRTAGAGSRARPRADTPSFPRPPAARPASSAPARG